mmetsp:Transcript_13720/g.43163  ORF Transcript_13720/g.43163 Transcript_13720/m.43163 type:complete len:265 (-) Transcript_13720:539-1333(-)
MRDAVMLDLMYMSIMRARSERATRHPMRPEVPAPTKKTVHMPPLSMKLYISWTAAASDSCRSASDMPTMKGLPYGWSAATERRCSSGSTVSVSRALPDARRLPLRTAGRTYDAAASLASWSDPYSCDSTSRATRRKADSSSDDRFMDRSLRHSVTRGARDSSSARVSSVVDSSLDSPALASCTSERARLVVAMVEEASVPVESPRSSTRSSSTAASAGAEELAAAPASDTEAMSAVAPVPDTPGWSKRALADDGCSRSASSPTD